MTMKASELVAILQAEIAEHGDGVAQVNAMGNWLLIAKVTSWHGRTIIHHEPFSRFPMERR